LRIELAEITVGKDHRHLAISIHLSKIKRF
jgi:hypothetical protein